MRSPNLHIKIVDARERGRLTEADLHIGKQKHHVYFRCNDLAIAGQAETFVTPALLSCMRKGYNLIVDGTLSPRLLKAMDTIQDIYCAWEPSLHRVQIQVALPERRPSPKESRIGTFFSAGVDSFYTFLKHRDEITDLIFIHGFDMKLEDHSLRRSTSERLHKIASEFGKRVVDEELCQALLRLLNPGRPRWQLKAMREVRRVGRQIQSIWG